MNEDTKELMLWVESEDKYKWHLIEALENELWFYYKLFLCGIAINNELGYKAIDISKVNGNEIYLQMKELFGNETCFRNELGFRNEL